MVGLRNALRLLLKAALVLAGILALIAVLSTALFFMGVFGPPGIDR